MSDGYRPIPDPIPRSYYSREALPPATVFSRAQRRVTLQLSSLRDVQLPSLSGRVLVAASAAAALFLVGGIVLALHRSPSGPQARTPAPKQSLPVAAAGSTPSTQPTPTPTPMPTPTPTPTPTHTPAPPTVTVHDTTARRGGRATVQAMTVPNISCSIAIGYPSAPALPPAVSAGDGAVSWTWQVALTAPRGSWLTVVTCGRGTGSAHLNITR